MANWSPQLCIRNTYALLLSLPGSDLEFLPWILNGWESLHRGEHGFPGHSWFPLHKAEQDTWTQSADVEVQDIKRLYQPPFLKLCLPFYLQSQTLSNTTWTRHLPIICSKLNWCNGQLHPTLVWLFEFQLLWFQSRFLLTCLGAADDVPGTNSHCLHMFLLKTHAVQPKGETINRIEKNTYCSMGCFFFFFLFLRVNWSKRKGLLYEDIKKTKDLWN